MTTQDARLQLIISGDPRGAQRALQALGQNLKTVGTQAGGLNQALKTAGMSVGATLRTIGTVAVATGAAVAAIGLGLKSFTDSAAMAAGEVERLTRITGLSTQRASELRAGAQVLGVEFSTLEGAINSMLGQLKSLNSADNPFRILGIGVVNQSGQLRDFGEILDQTLTKLQAMGQTGARAMFAQKLFGGATPELLRLIDQGPEGLRKAAEAAKQMGLVMTPEQIQAAARYRMAVRQVGQAWEGVKITIGNAVMPALTNLAKWLTQGAQTWIPALKNALGPIIQFFGRLWDVTTNALGVMRALFRAFLDGTTAGQRLQNMAKGLREVFGRFSAGLKDLAEWLSRLKERIVNGDVGGALQEMWDKLMEGMDKVGPWLLEQLPKLGEQIGGLLSGLGEWLSKPETLEKIGEFSSKLGGLLVDAIVAVGGFLIKAVPGLIDALIGLFGAVMKGMLSFLKGFGEELVKKIAEGITWTADNWDGIKMSLQDWWDQKAQWFKDIGKSIADTLKDMWKWVPGAWDGIWTSLSDWWTQKTEPVRELGTKIKGALSEAWTWAASAWDSIWTSLSTWWEGVKAKVQGIGDAFRDSFLGRVLEAISSTVDKLRELKGLLSGDWKWPWSDKSSPPPAPTYTPLPPDSVPSPNTGGSRDAGAAVTPAPAPTTVPSPTPPSEPTTPVPLSNSFGHGAAKDNSAEAAANEAKLLDRNYVESEIIRANNVIKKREKAGMPTVDQEAYLERLLKMREEGITPMAEGGIVRARPGGKLIRAGEAGKDEGIIPLDSNVLQRAGLGGGPRVLNLTVLTTLDGKVMARETKRIMMDDMKMQKQLAF